MPDKAEHTDWLARGRDVLAVEAEGLEAVRASLGESFVRAVHMMAECPGRVVVTGIGKSGLVGRKIAATLSSTGTPAAFLHPVEGAHGDLGMIRPGDVVLAISNSGETDELNAILPSLASLGAQIIGLTRDESSTLGRLADVCVKVAVPREACSLNLAPTASTTAQLGVGDALAVCLIDYKHFEEADFMRCHPGGALGRRLSMPVAEIMHKESLPLAEPATPLARALTVMTAGGLGLVGVVDANGRLAGVLSDGDVRRILASGVPDTARPVADFMTANPRRIRQDESAAAAVDVMEEMQITVLPVVNEDGIVTGMVHLHDLLGKGRFKFSL